LFRYSFISGSHIARRTRRTITYSRSSRRTSTRRWSVTHSSARREKWRRQWRWLWRRPSTRLIRRGSCHSPIPGSIMRRIRALPWQVIGLVRKFFVLVYLPDCLIVMSRKTERFFPLKYKKIE